MSYPAETTVTVNMPQAEGKPPAYSAAPDPGSVYQPTNAYPPYPPGNAYPPYPPGNAPYPPPAGSYPPYPYYANSPGGYAQTPQPITVTYTTAPGGTRTTQPQSSTTIVYQTGGNCPKCHVSIYKYIVQASRMHTGLGYFVVIIM